MLFLFIHCALRLEQPDILFYFPLFDKLLRCYGQCLGREQQGYVLHYWRKFSEFILFLIKWVVAVLSAMLRKGAHWRCVLSEGEERKKYGDFGGSGAKLAFLLNLTDLLYCI